MRLSVTRDKYAGHRRSPWLVVVPCALSATGKRQYRRFATRSAAAAFVADLRRHVRESGEQPLAMLPAHLAADARAAASLLEGTGMRLVEAVQHLMELLQQQGVAMSRFLPSGGAGERGSRSAPASAARDALTLNSALAAIEAAREHQSAATKRTRRGVLQTLFARNDGLADTPLDLCTPAMLEAAMDTAWPDAPASWNGCRRALHSLFGYAIKRRLVSMENPVTPLDFKQVREQEITALPPEHLRALLISCAARADYQAHLAICAFAGVRPVECSRLTWGDIDWEENVLSVRAQNSKTGGTRHIELCPTLRAWLLACKPAHVESTAKIVETKDIIRTMQKVRAAAGFGGGKWQSDCLRHSYATYYLKGKCGTLSQLQVNMGHRDSHLLYTRYTNMRGVTRAMADAWWNILP